MLILIRVNKTIKNSNPAEQIRIIIILYILFIVSLKVFILSLIRFIEDTSYIETIFGEKFSCDLESTFFSLISI